MKKRNFILDFALKSKYNFFACLVALLVLIFSVSSITYAWIEGATQIVITASEKVFSGTGKAINITSTESSNNIVELDSYIDPTTVYLAPATGAINESTKLIDITFNDRSADTVADTNDISNNYLFCEVKVHCADLITDLAFEGSSITIDEGIASTIKTGITLLDADRNPISSGIFSAEQVSNGVIAAEGLAKNGTYIVQVKIWYQPDENTGDSLNGREVKVDLNLVPKKDVVTLKFEDYTNDATTQKLLSSKTVKIKYNGQEYAADNTADGVYTFENVPSSLLKRDSSETSDIQFIAYDGSDVYATWSATGFSKTVLTYRAYGDPTKSTGTHGNIQQVYVNDLSVENLLNADTNLMINNAIDPESYVMYHGSSTDTYSVYVPAESVGQTLTFSNGSYTLGSYSKDASEQSATFKAGVVLDSAKPYLNIYGETLQKSVTKTLCLCEWSAVTPTRFVISMKDKTAGSAVTGLSVYTSYGTLDTAYKAYYNETEKAWQIATISTYLGASGGEVWRFGAYDSSSAQQYEWNDESTNARPSGMSTYYFTSTSTGTWEFKGSAIDPAILTGEKVSFYAGIPSTWNSLNTIFVHKSDRSAVAEETSFNTKQYNNIKYSVASVKNVDPLIYYISNKPAGSGNDDNHWLGDSIKEKAVGGKFYGIYGTNESDHVVYTDGPVTGVTTVGGSDGALKASPIVLSKSTENVAFSTQTSQVKSFLNQNLYIEYHICDADNESNGYTCLNPYLGGSQTDNPPTNTLVSSTTTDVVIDLKSYAAESSKTYKLQTVLTDGTVYYVSDTDYIKFADAKTVTIADNTNAAMSATLNGTTVSNVTGPITVYSGDTLVVTAAQNSTSGKSKFTWTVNDAAGVTSDLNTSSTYTFHVTDDTPDSSTISVDLEQYYQINLTNADSAVSTCVITDNAETPNTVTSREYVLAGTTLKITATKTAAAAYNFIWSATGSQNTSQTDSLIDQSDTSTYVVNSISADTTVTLSYQNLYKVTYPDNATLDTVPTVGYTGYAYFTSGTTGIQFTAIEPGTSNYAYAWTVKYAGGSTSSGQLNTFTLTGALTQDAEVTLSITEITNRTLLLTGTNVTHAIVTYGSEATVLQPDEATEVPVNAVVTIYTADGITKGTYNNLNGYVKDNITVTEGSISTSDDTTNHVDKATYTVPAGSGTSDAITITVSTKPETFYICGSGISDIDWENTGKPMTLVGNILTADITLSSNDVEFKIAERGVGQRDSNIYCVNYNLTADDFTTGDGITNKGINSNTNFEFSAISGQTYTVTYDLVNNKVNVAKKVVTYTVGLGSVNNGSIAAQYGDTTIDNTTDKLTVPEGGSITVTATPSDSEKYEVKSIKVGSTQYTSSNSNFSVDSSGVVTLTGVIINSNVQIQAVISEKAVTRTIYYQDTQLRITDEPTIWYWGDKNYASTENYSWPGPAMKLVDQTNKIFAITLTGDSANATKFRFNGGSTECTWPGDGRDMYVEGNGWQKNNNPVDSSQSVNSNYYVVGDLVDTWNPSNNYRMKYSSLSSKTVEVTLTVTQTDKPFKILHSFTKGIDSVTNDYYTYNNSTSRDIESLGEYNFSEVNGTGNNSTFKLPVGTYKFTFCLENPNKELVIEEVS